MFEILGVKCMKFVIKPFLLLQINRVGSNQKRDNL